MKDINFHKEIKEIRKIKMTADEKSRILEYVLSSPSLSSPKLIKSPWTLFSFISTFSKNRFVYYGLTILLFVLIGGGGLVFASQKTLPGNFLYPLKVNVVEPLRATLTLSPEAKAQYENSLVTKRLVEAETLASQGQLDTPKQEQINNLLSEHTTALNKAISDVRTVESGEKADAIISNFHVGINEHIQISRTGNIMQATSTLQENTIEQGKNIKAKKITSSDYSHNTEEHSTTRNNLQSLIIISTTTNLDVTVTTVPNNPSVVSSTSSSIQKIINSDDARHILKKDQLSPAESNKQDKRENSKKRNSK